jgi:hypothetical protein
MANEKTIGDYGVKEGDHMVLMVTQPPSKAKPTTVPATSSTKTPDKSSPIKTTKEQPKESAKVAKPEIPMEDTPEFHQAIQTIVEMGYSDKQVVEKALRVSFGNPDRAVELLESVFAT